MALPMALCLAMGALCLAIGAMGVANAQPRPPQSQADMPETFWQRLGTSVPYNRANEKVGRLYFASRIGGVAYDIDRPSQLHAGFVPNAVSVDTDLGAWGALAVGTGLGNNLRSEMEVSILQLSASVCLEGNQAPRAPDTHARSCEEIDPAVTNIMLHAYYDIDIPALLDRDFGGWNHFLFYVGAGFGYSFSNTSVNWAARNHGDADAPPRVHTRLGAEKINWTINAGMLYRQLEFGYRYLQGPTNIKGHQFFVGYQF